MGSCWACDSNSVRRPCGVSKHLEQDGIFDIVRNILRRTRPGERLLKGAAP